MKKIIVSVFALAAVAFAANAAGGSGSTTSTGKAELVRSLTLLNVISDDGSTTVVNGGVLDFGKISLDGITGTGTATITPAAGATTNAITAVTVTNGLSAMTSTKSAAVFKVTGYEGAAYHVSLPADLALTGVSSGVSIAFNSNVGSSTIGTGGSSIFMVGGTLSVPSTTMPGEYSGTFSVTVNYN